MPHSAKRRLWLAIVLSFLAHLTAAVLLLPIWAAIRAARALLDPENGGLRVALLLAVLLHAALVLPLLGALLDLSDWREEPAGALRVDLWSREGEGAEEEEEERTPVEELEDYEPIEEIPEGQVVVAPASPDSRRPDRRRFLAERDSRVERETRARDRAPGDGAAVSSAASEGRGRDAEEIPGGMRAEIHGASMLPSDLERAEEGEAPAEVMAPVALEDVSLRPSRSAMASALAGTGLDHLDGVIEADRTALDTVGWKHASFFNRVKRAVERYWHPGIEYERHDPYGHVYGFKSRTTVLLVVLRGDGTLEHLYVMEPSGAAFLDDEAYEAVERAAPFPNVPAGLMDERDGLVKFTFHFVVEVGSGPIFRVRRYR